MNSLRSRRSVVVGARKNARARGYARGEGALTPLTCLPLARPFFLAPTTTERLLRRLDMTKFADLRVVSFSLANNTLFSVVLHIELALIQ